MNAADSSWRTWTKRIFFSRWRKRLHDAVDAVARQTEDNLYTPVVKRIEKNIRCSIRHG